MEWTKPSRYAEVNPFHKMKKADYIEECRRREILYEGDDLKAATDAFKSFMAGIFRVPALRFRNRKFSFLSSGMKKYEVSPVAPLHDIKGHIKNLWTELPYILNDG